MNHMLPLRVMVARDRYGPVFRPVDRALDKGTGGQDIKHWPTASLHFNASPHFSRFMLLYNSTYSIYHS